jgi:hypothetical protein
MAALEAIIFAAAAGFAFVIVIVIIVIVGVRQEERYFTLANRNAPSAIAQLARVVLGRHVRRESTHVASYRRPADSAAPSKCGSGSKD